MSTARRSVLIVGAGPTGLTLANLLGGYGIDVDVLESGDALIDYPRAVGVDDESLRVFQTAGVVDDVLPHTSPDHAMRFLGADGRLIAEISPGMGQFGWSRRNSFIQPLVDAELLRGLERFDHVRVHFGETCTGVDRSEHGVRVRTTGPGGARTWDGAYLVGADGGRSSVRKAVDVSFDGTTESTRWLVVDLAGDPIGTPNLYVGCDPRRPHVSIQLPHGVRRIELMLHDGEDQSYVDDPDNRRALLAPFVPDSSSVQVIRARVYTHHARVAGSFRVGRVLLAGDAAHLMPVWQGQGFNSGIRDASNLAWKLAAVLRDISDDRLLDSYDVERRPHATAMVKLSAFVGRIISPTRQSVARVRDRVFLALNAVPSAKRYLTEMRFKPMPRYEAGAVAHDREPPAKDSPVGRMFPQPRVTDRDGRAQRLDEVLGDWFSVVVWSNPVDRVLDEETRAVWRAVGARIVEIRPMSQLAWRSPDEDPGSGVVVGDVDGDVKRWFDQHPVCVVVVRPDRIVAGAALAQDAGRLTSAVARAASVTVPAGTTAAPVAAANGTPPTPERPGHPAASTLTP